MKVDGFGNDGGPAHLQVRLDDGRLAPATQFGDTDADREDIQRRNAASVAADRSEEITRLAALIREVDGNHSLGAAALAEALTDRGVRFRPGE